MQVLDFSPMKESLRTLVKVLILNGMWSLFIPSERMHSCGTHSVRWWLPVCMTVSLSVCRSVHLPSEPGGCGWSRLSQPKCCGRWCWCRCHVRSRPDRPVRIYRAVCWRGHCVWLRFGEWHGTGMSWHLQMSDLMFWREEGEGGSEGPWTTKTYSLLLIWLKVSKCWYDASDEILLWMLAITSHGANRPITVVAVRMCRYICGMMHNRLHKQNSLCVPSPDNMTFILWQKLN